MNMSNTVEDQFIECAAEGQTSIALVESHRVLAIQTQALASEEVAVLIRQQRRSWRST
jgi:hypothetical protein